jgi:uncharacterized phiE125 gp8 family phage protein
MSITLQFGFEVAGVAADVTSAVLRDETVAYGVKRDDTDAVVVAAGTAMTWVATGTYEYEFTPPADGLTYTWVVEYVYGGETYHNTFSYADTTRIVTIVEAKEQLRILHDGEDLYIGTLIDAATSWAEKYQGRKYLTQTCVDYLDAWPAVIRPRWLPLFAVTSIQYIDDGGTLQTWDADEYDVDSDTEPGRIIPAYGESFPSIRGDVNGIIVTYTAGYGTDAEDVPGEIRTAILMIVAHWYANREAVSDLSMAEVPMGAHALLGLERMYGV